MGQDSELDKAALLEQVKVHQAEYNRCVVLLSWGWVGVVAGVLVASDLLVVAHGGETRLSVVLCCGGLIGWLVVDAWANGAQPTRSSPASEHGMRRRTGEKASRQ